MTRQKSATVLDRKASSDEPRPLLYARTRSRGYRPARGTAHARGPAARGFRAG